MSAHEQDLNELVAVLNGRLERRHVEAVEQARAIGDLKREVADRGEALAKYQQACGDHQRRAFEATADRDRARDAAVALEQENAAARALHAKRDVFEVGPGGTLGQWLSSGCEECSDPDLIADLEAGELTEDLAPWPCPTILALDGGER